DGTVLCGKMVYRDIQKPTSLTVMIAFSDANRGEARHPFSPSWPMRTLCTITFDGIGNKTMITVDWRPLDPTEEERSTFAAGMDGMKQGWAGTMDQLAAYL